jgi:hypothetical protein
VIDEHCTHASLLNQSVLDAVSNGIYDTLPINNLKYDISHIDSIHSHTSHKKYRESKTKSQINHPKYLPPTSVTMRFSCPSAVFLSSILLLVDCGFVVNSFVVSPSFYHSPSFSSSLIRPLVAPIQMSASASTTNTVQDGTDDALLDQILQVAIDASKKAGEIILGNAGGAEVTERKANSRDLLTLIDPLCEKVRQSYTSQTHRHIIR